MNGETMCGKGAVCEWVGFINFDGNLVEGLVKSALTSNRRNIGLKKLSFMGNEWNQVTSSPSKLSQKALKKGNNWVRNNFGQDSASLYEAHGFKYIGFELIVIFVGNFIL